MSMIIDWASKAAAAIALWGMVLVLLPFGGPPDRQVAVIGPVESTVPAIVAAGGRLVDVRGSIVIARSPDSGFAAELYRRGALLVVEGRVAAGCLKR